MNISIIKCNDAGAEELLCSYRSEDSAKEAMFGAAKEYAKSYLEDTGNEVPLYVEDEGSTIRLREIDVTFTISQLELKE